MRLRMAAAVAGREWREILRDRVFFLLAFFMPVTWMFVFGYGLDMEARDVPVAVLDQDHSMMSREYVQRYRASRYFSLRPPPSSLREAEQQLEAGRLRAVVVIPEGFERDIEDGRSVAIQTLLDGTFAYRVQAVSGYLEAVNADLVRTLQAEQLAQRLGVSPDRAALLLRPVRLQVRYLYNEALSSIWSIAPSLLMFTLMIAPAVLTSLSVVREKESGSICNFQASTLSRGEYLAGKLLPNVAISFANAVVLWLLATWHFGAPFKGGFGFFLLASLAYVLCTCSIGLLVSVLAATQSSALLVTIVMVVVPATQFSGMFTPVALLPPFNQALAHLLPPMYYQRIVHGTFLKGAGAAGLWPDALVLMAYAGSLLGLCWLRLKKRVWR